MPAFPLVSIRPARAFLPTILSLLLIPLFFATPGRAQRALGVGDAATFQRETTLLPAGLGKISAEALEGKVVVLEFWATWCIPCVAAFPHWNELAEAFDGESMILISATEEDEATVRPFLEERPLLGTVVLDQDGSLFETYGVESLPHTVLIGRDGRVQAVTQPNQVTAQLLQAMVDGEDPKRILRHFESAEPASAVAASEESDGSRPVFQAMIRRASVEAPPSMVAYQPRHLEITGVQADFLIAWAFQADSRHVKMDPDLAETLDEQRWDVLFTTHGDPEKLREAAQGAIEASLGVEATRELQKVQAWELRPIEGADVSLPAPDAQPTSPGLSQPGRLQVPLAKLQQLAFHLGTAMDRVIFDATGNPEMIRVDLTWDPEDPATLDRALAETFGVELVPVQRNVELLVVRSLDDARADRQEAGEADDPGPAPDLAGE